MIFIAQLQQLSLVHLIDGSQVWLNPMITAARCVMY